MMPPIADFDVILIHVDGQEHKMINSYGLPIWAVEELHSFVWKLVPGR